MRGVWVLLLVTYGSVIQLSPADAASTTVTYKPDSNVTGTVWRMDSNFVYPELSDGPYGIPKLRERPSFSIAVGGASMLLATRAMQLHA